MSENETLELLPSDIRAEASEAISKLLPSKSRLAYEKEYKNFQKWKNVKNIKGQGSTENVLLAYFSEKSKKMQPSSLWSYYSMLKSTILVNENINISR